METSAGRAGTRGATGTAVRDEMIGRLVDGRYRVQSRIARGGMATVYLALDERLERLVALKVMHPGLAEDEAFVARFQREAKSAARLTHPHVVSVYDQGESGQLVYLAMEYVAGRTLRDVLRDHGRLSPEQALTILDPVLQALVAAHHAGFVHRDIKPENVLLGDDGTVKVADFGLARAISTTNSTATQGVLIGTVAYLSPEQVERGIADARSDVYGCGILLYEMLTGAVPYAGETPLAVAYQHVNAAVPRPSSVQPGVPPPVDELVSRATLHDPDARWHDAAEFLGAVRAVRDALPHPRPLTVDLTDDAHTLIVATPTSAAASPAADGGKVRKARKVRSARRPRRRGWVVLLAILLVAGLVGGIGWWYGSARSVPVPPVVGMTLAEAQAQFVGSDLSIEAGENVYSETIAKGEIVTTDPGPGEQARAGSIVTAAISQGPERYAVPAITNVSVQDARDQLAATGGLVAADDVQRAYDPMIAKGLVIGTDPAAGKSLRRDTPVTLIVSRGPEPVPVPKVVGLTLSDAKAMLDKAGLGVASTKDAYNMKQPAGRVVSVTPPVGDKLVRGDSVALVVSLGPPPVEVPSVFRMSESDATALLKSKGFRVNVEYPSGFSPLNTVYWQSVGGGDTAPKGSTIVIRVF